MILEQSKQTSVRRLHSEKKERIIRRKKPLREVESAELTQILEVVHEESFLKDPDRKGWYDLAKAYPFLERKDLHEHIICNQSRDKGISSLNSEAHVYDVNNLIFRNLEIKLEVNWQLKQDFIWTSHPLHAKWHFEHCRFTSTSPNTGTIVFGWRGDFRFHKNEFDFGDSKGMRAWMFAFRHGSSVLLQENEFKDSTLQIQHRLSQEHDPFASQNLSWEGRTAHVVKDRNYYETMIRRKYEIPETVRLLMPDMGPWRPGLASLSFLGNKGIRDLQMECNAAYYDFRGMNCINSLRFRQLSTIHDDEGAFEIYFGSRERIDPNFDNPHGHRQMFLTLREFAAKRQDSRIASNFDKQIDRIDYFLTREQRVSFRDDRRGLLEYWQDRILYEWRRLSSDYYRSWLRPLLWLLAGYLISNGLPSLLMEEFTWHNWMTFSLRPIHRMPFYAAELQAMMKAEYQRLSSGDIVLLTLIGFVQVIWIALWGFAFGRSVKR